MHQPNRRPHPFVVQPHWLSLGRLIHVQDAVRVLVQLSELIHDFAAVRTLRVEPLVDLLLRQTVWQHTALLVGVLEAHQLRSELWAEQSVRT